MPNQTIDAVLDRWRQEMAESLFSKAHEAGKSFERLCLAFFRYDPEQRLQFSKVWHHDEWAASRGDPKKDTGIDLVAECVDGGFAAIQCKFRAEGSRIPKKEIDSFLSDSSTADFTRRIFVDTTGVDWSANVEAMLRKQAIPVTRLGLHVLRASPVDWSRFVTGEEDEVPITDPPVLRPHQVEAIDRIAAGLAGEGSRGKAIMACGTGKTLTALRAAERLSSQGGRVLYLVPSLALMSQTIHAWARDTEVRMRVFAVCSDSQVGKRMKSRDDSIDMDALDLAWPATTDAVKLAERASSFAAEAMTVVFATYQSSHVIETAQREHGLPAFDLAVCDEAHRTAGAMLKDEDPSNFTRIHGDSHIRAARRLYSNSHWPFRTLYSWGFGNPVS